MGGSGPGWTGIRVRPLARDRLLHVEFASSCENLRVIRVAGNMLGPSINGTLQYAGAHLHTPLFVILGHEGCGAVEAAIAEKFHDPRHGSRIASLLDNINPSLAHLDSALPPAAMLRAAVEANVR